MRAKKAERKVYEYLLKQLTDGSLGPNSKIVEQEVAQQLGVSRSPVRSALQILEGEGYLKLVPYKGALVLEKPMDTTAYVEQLKVFELLFSQYLFQLEAKSGVLDDQQLAQQLSQIAKGLSQLSREEIVALEVDLLELLLSEQANHYYKTLLLTLMKEALITDFSHTILPEEDSLLLFFEHFKQVVAYLKKGEHPQARREVRIFINGLTLAVIDKQDLGQLNKYES